METCFCGKIHYDDVYLKHKCLDCSIEKEKLLWNWLCVNTNIQIVNLAEIL